MQVSRTDHGDGKQFLRRMQKMPWRRLVIERKPHIAYYQILYIEKCFYKCHTPWLRFSYIFPTIGTDKMTNVDKCPGGMSTHGIDWAISLLQQFKWNTIKIRLPRLIIKAFYGSNILTILDFFFQSLNKLAVVERLFRQLGTRCRCREVRELKKEALGTIRSEDGDGSDNIA